MQSSLASTLAIDNVLLILASSVLDTTNCQIFEYYQGSCFLIISVVFLLTFICLLIILVGKKVAAIIVASIFFTSILLWPWKYIDGLLDSVNLACSIIVIYSFVNLVDPRNRLAPFAKPVSSERHLDSGSDNRNSIKYSWEQGKLIRVFAIFSVVLSLGFMLRYHAFDAIGRTVDKWDVVREKELECITKNIARAYSVYVINNAGNEKEMENLIAESTGPIDYGTINVASVGIHYTPRHFSWQQFSIGRMFAEDNLSISIEIVFFNRGSDRRRSNPLLTKIFRCVKLDSGEVIVTELHKK